MKEYILTPLIDAANQLGIPEKIYAFDSSAHVDGTTQDGQPFRLTLNIIPGGAKDNGKL